MEHIKTKETVALKGVYKITKAKLETPEQWALHNEIKKLRDEGNEYMPLVRKLNQICKTEVFEVENIIPITGRTLLANNLTNASPTNTTRISHVALGTGTTAPANGDTILETETFRKTISSESNSSNIGYATGFFDAQEVNGTFFEAGLFCDGSLTANTGVLFSHILLNTPTGIAKSSSETLSIDWQITFT